MRRMMALACMAVVLLGTAPVAVAATSTQATPTDLPTLLLHLKTGDAAKRAEAVRKMGEMGEAASAGLSELRGALKDPDAAVRAAAETAVRLVATARAEALVRDLEGQPLADVLGDTDSYVRSAAVRKLRALGPAAIPGLVEVIRKAANEEASDRAGRLLVYFGEPSVAALFPVLKDGNSRARRVAADFLGRMDVPPKSAIPHLIGALGDPDPETRKEVIGTLSTIETGATEAALALARLVEVDPELAVRVEAAYALKFVHRDAESVVPALVAALGDKEMRLRRRAAQTLWALGGAAKAATSALEKAALDDADLFVRLEAASALHVIDPGAGGLSHLLDAARSDSADVRRAAVQVLGGTGPTAKTALPHLLRYLKDPNAAVRAAAAWACRDIGPEAEGAVPALAAALDDPDTYVRCNAAGALRDIRRNAAVAVPALAAAVSKRTDSTRSWAMLALEKFGPEAESAVGALVDVLRTDTDPYMRAEAADALGAIGPGARAAVEPLKLALAGQGLMRARAAAAGALPRIDPATLPQALPVLLAGLRDENEYVRERVARTFEHLGPLAKEAVPALEAALKDDVGSVRRAAAAALKKVRGGG